MTAILGSEWIVAVLLFITYGFFFQGGGAPQNSRFDLSLALTFEHRLSIDTFHENTIDKAYYNGKYFSEKSPITAYLAAPVPLLATMILKKSDVTQNKKVADLLLYLGTLFSVSLLSAVSAIFFRRLLIIIHSELEESTSYLITLVIYGATLILPYSTLLMSHQISGSLLVLSLYFGLCDQHFRSRCLAFFFMGMASACEYPVALLSLAIGTVILLNAENKRTLLKPFLFSLLPMSILLIHNTLCFDSPLSFGYGRLQATAFAQVMSSGFFGVRGPSLPNFLQLLFGLYRGLFVYSPILIAAVLSYQNWPQAKFRKTALPLLLGCFALIVFISGYGYWQGGACFGPRHLVPCIPILALGFAYFPTGLLKKLLFQGSLVISAWINALATVITPFATEMDTNPLFQSYKSLARSGLVSVNPVNFLTSHDEALRLWEHWENNHRVATNLGERLLGLSGWFSVLPLIVLWSIGIRVLVTQIEFQILPPDLKPK